MDGDFAWKVILTLGVLVSIISNVWSLRRKPPLGEELYQHFLTRKEWSERCRDIHQELNKQLSTGSDRFREIERALGRIEGKLEQALSDRRPLP